MSTLEATTDTSTEQQNQESVTIKTPPLRDCVRQAVENYFAQLDGQPTYDLYGMVLAEVEEPLLHAVMAEVQGNQSKAAQVLGLSRGTLRKKLEIYELL